jgi:hypothetical protein
MTDFSCRKQRPLKHNLNSSQSCARQLPRQFGAALRFLGSVTFDLPFVTMSENLSLMSNLDCDCHLLNRRDLCCNAGIPCSVANAAAVALQS